MNIVLVTPFYIYGGLEPTEGDLSVDGQPITEENHRAWFAHIAHVPQDIYLSDSAIEENIAFGKLKEEINNDRVRQTARQAHISDMIERLPDQYSTYVGERGIRLSGGQRQGIAIARALLSQASLLLLDEPSNAMDNVTEASFISGLREYVQDKTLILVTHRSSMLALVDRLIVINLGKVVIDGPREEVLEKLASGSNQQ